MGLVIHGALTRLWVVFYNASVIRTQPIIALMVFRGGVDITQLQGTEAQHLLNVLVQSVTIGSYPHAAVLIQHQVLGGVLAQRGGIKLIVLKLLHLLRLRVYHKESLVVSHNPYPATLVHTYVPHLQPFW